ncbi:MAG: dienelactone hydrolase family protein [Chloroflexota bacterium]
MSEKNFSKFNQQVQQHFADQTYTEGLSLTSKHLTEYPEHFALVNYWRICMAAQINEFPLANKIFESTLASGIWYAEFLMRQSPSLEGIQGDPEFERLVEISLRMAAADPPEKEITLVARPEDACGPGQDGCQTLIFLHGDTDTARRTIEQLVELPGKGWLVGLPQSEYVLWTDGYSWADHQSGIEQVNTRYAKLKEEYSIDPARTVLGGYSMGAEVALAAALSGTVEAAGFICLGLAGPNTTDPDQWSELINQARGKALRGVLFLGEEDFSMPLENVELVVEKLNQAGIETKLIAMPGVSHVYPENFDALLDQAFEFIFG